MLRNATVISIAPLEILMSSLWVSSTARALGNFFIVAPLCAMSFAAVLRFGALPRDPMAGVAVVFPPWTTSDQTFARAVGAGAKFVRFGGFDFIAIVRPDDSEYVERIFSDHAILALDPQFLAGCLPAS
jgi:hypothetical protein